MLSTKKLVKMATKWRREALVARNKILLLKVCSITSSPRSSNISAVANRGHFVVYATDHGRFVIPLPYLNNSIFRELLKMSEEEVGLPGDGPITLPCDSLFLEYVVSLLRRGFAMDEEKAKLMSVITSRCSLSSSLLEGLRNQHILACN